MPAKHSIKTYVENGIYHVYNRGVEKRLTFLNTQDYRVFLRFLKDALSPPETVSMSSPQVQYLQTNRRIDKRKSINYQGEIELLAYCLMPNHYHLILRQTKAKTIIRFMKSIITRYGMYFNKKYHRVGNLFQGRYKGNLVLDDAYLLHLSRYIHRNPMDITDDLRTYFSSYGEYLGLRHTQWINPTVILDYFKPGLLPGLMHIHTYEDFVETYDEKDTELLNSFSFEDDASE